MTRPPTETNRLLCVAIPTCNRKAMLKRTARSILAQIDADVRLLIIDNVSTDGTDETIADLAAADSRVWGVYEPVAGSSSARNAALNKAESEWVLFVDDDEEVDEGWFAAYKQFLGSPPSPNIACVGGPYVARFDTEPPTWIDPSTYDFNRGATICRLEGRGGTGAGNCAYHRARTIAVGSFNNQLGRIGEFLGAHEETELNSRLQQAGYELWWLPTARILHGRL